MTIPGSNDGYQIYLIQVPTTYYLADKIIYTGNMKARKACIYLKASSLDSYLPCPTCRYSRTPTDPHLLLVVANQHRLQFSWC